LFGNCISKFLKAGKFHGETGVESRYFQERYYKKTELVETELYEVLYAVAVSCGVE